MDGWADWWMGGRMGEWMDGRTIEAGEHAKFLNVEWMKTHATTNVTSAPPPQTRYENSQPPSPFLPHSLGP